MTFGGKQGANVLCLDESITARKLRALQCYSHVLPYNGKTMPKWEALLHRYIEVGGYEFDVESYDIFQASEKTP